jgi:hypothetical protein
MYISVGRSGILYVSLKEVSMDFSDGDGENCQVRDGME